MIPSNKLKVSFNARLVDKIPPSEPRFYADSFEAVEVDAEEFEENIKLGFAFSYQFKNNYRNSENFLCSDVVVIDIDGGVTLGQALGNQTVKQYGTFCYTTASHNFDHHRFRLVFALPRTISDPNELKFATRALAQRLGGNKRSTDPARLFLGNSNCNFEQLGAAISPEFLDELLDDGRLEVMSESIMGNRTTANRSNYKVPPTLQITLANGTKTTLRQIDGTRKIQCPFHIGDSGEAFVSSGKQGQFLYCSDCGKVWRTSAPDLSTHNFSEFDDFVRAIKAGVLDQAEEDLVGLEKFMGPERFEPKNVLIRSDRYVEADHLRGWDIKQGVTFIKSPKGTGKTQFVSRAINKYLNLTEFEEGEDDEAPSGYFSKDRVLLIGHRQALIGELSKRLQLNSYLNDTEYKDPGQIAQRKKRYGVCLDSLWRVKDQTYDVVVIDEVEQVLSHFLSDTIGNARERIFDVFARLIRTARQIIVLDADIDWPSFGTLQMLRSLQPADRWDVVSDEENTPIKIYLNEWKETGRFLYLYEDHDHMVRKLQTAILEKKRVFVTSNSKSKIDALASAVRDLSNRIGEDIPSIKITSENAKSEKIQSFIKNIKKQVLDYQVILTSPSLGTGVDITFENGAQEIDSVFGFFESRVNTHFDIDQQLGRVRNPKDVHVWISPQRFNFETEFEVVVNDLLRSDLIAGLRRGFQWRSPRQVAEDDPLLTMAALITVKNRASKNNLKDNFVRHKKEQGWGIAPVARDKALAKEGRQLIKLGRQLSLDEDAKKLLNARVLNQVEHLELRRKLEFGSGEITEEERYNLRRTNFELFYHTPATKDLVVQDNQGRFRGQIRMFERLTEVGSSVDGKSSLTDRRAEIIKDRDTRAKLIRCLLEKTPIYDGQDFRTDVSYKASDLVDFADACTKMKRVLEGQFELATRSDVRTRAVQQLGSILHLIGLNHTLVSTKKVRDKKVRYYQLEAVALQAIREIVERRQKSRKRLSDVFEDRVAELYPDGWNFINQHYGFEYSEDEIELLMGGWY